MRGSMRRAIRDTAIVTILTTTPITALLALQGSTGSYEDVFTLPWEFRHGLDGVVAATAIGDEPQPVDGLACFDVADMPAEMYVPFLEQFLADGVRAIVVSDDLYREVWDFADEAGDTVEVDETSPLYQLLATDERVVSPAWHEVELRGADALDATPTARLYPPEIAPPHPPGGLAPLTTVGGPIRNGVGMSALVVELEDGDLAPSLPLAALVLGSGASGPIEVDADAVTASGLSIAAEHGWIATWPPGHSDFGWSEPVATHTCESQAFLYDDGEGGAHIDGGWRDTPDVVYATYFDAVGDEFGRDYAMLVDGDRARGGSRLLTFALTFVGALVVTFVGRTESWWAGLATFGLVIGGAFGVAVATYDFGPTYNMLPIVLATVPAYLLAVLLRGRANRRRTRELEVLVTEYVPRELTGDLIASRQDDPLVTGEREATVVFCDLRDFTPTVADLDPADVQRLLEIFYRHVGDRVRAAGGTLVQYIGDEVFATFGPPAVIDDHADRALACARALRDAADEFARELHDDGFPTLRYGVGLHTGRIVTAEVGGDQHRQYTVIGDAVNVGSRLTTAAGPGEVLFSGDLLARVHDRPDSEQLLEVRLKGVERPLEVYRLS